MSMAAVAVLLSGLLPVLPSAMPAFGSSPHAPRGDLFPIVKADPKVALPPVAVAPVGPVSRPALVRTLKADAREGTSGLVATSGVDAHGERLPTPTPPPPAPAAPSAPTGVIAVAGDTSATVVWSAPASTGGRAVTGYRVLASPGGRTCMSTGTLSCTVHGLANGVWYSFTVTATNSIGTGPASIPSRAVVPAAPIYVISGVVSGAGGPLAEVTVQAAGPSGACPCYTATTGADGRYAIEGVTPGTYRIHASDGHGTHVSGYYTATGTATIDISHATSVAVSDASVPGINIVLSTGFRVSGTITDSHGQARGHIYVMACDELACYGPPTASDEDGRYAIVLPPASYVIRIIDPNGVFPDGYYASSGFAFDRSEATPVDVSTADQSGIDVVLSGGLTGYSISGKATFAAGGSASSGVVALACTMTGSCLARTAVAAGGTYALVELPADTYYVRFIYQTEHAGWTEAFDGYYSTSGLAIAQALATSITLPYDATNVDLTLPVAQTIRGSLVGPGGVPLAGVNVSAGDRLRGNYQVTTGSDGRFAMPVDPGSYILRFDDPAHVYPFGYYGDGGYIREWASATAVSVEADGVDLGAIALPAGRSISGTLTGANGQPLAGVTVLASLRYWYGDAQTGVTDATGQFTIPDLGPGTYFLMEEGDATHARGFYSKSSPGHWNAHFDYSWVATTLVQVTGADVRGIAITVPAGYTLTGTVRNAEGDPIPGIGVEASDDGLWPETVTASDGTYRLTSVPAGSHTLSFVGDSTYAGGYYAATAPGAYSPESTAATSVSVAADRGGLDVVLPVGHSIAGVVSGPDGSSLGGAGVHVYACRHGTPEDGDCPFTLADTDGTFELRGLAPGSYVLAIRSVDGAYLPGYYDSHEPGNFTTDLTAATPLVIDAFDLSGITLEPTRAYTLSGTIRDTGAQPLVGADVLVCSVADLGLCYGTAAGVPTALDGTFMIANIPAGSYLLWVNAPSGYRNGYWSSEGWVMSRDEATPIPVPPDATDVVLAVPEAIGPGAPTNVAATSADRAAVVSWHAPAASGSTEIIGYTVMASDGHSGCTVAALTCTVTGLNNGQRYTFTVTAVNGVATGPASRPSSAITPAGAPGQPTKVAGIRGNGAVQVRWTAPSPNGAPISSYTVTSYPAGGSCTSATNKCIVGGLVDGTAYTFTVTATNAAGTSLASQPSAPVVPAAAASFSVTALTTAPIKAGESAKFRVTPLDASGGTLPGYTGKVHFTSSDPLAVLPADYTFTWADAGKHDFAGTFKTAGALTVTAEDVATQAGGTGSVVTVNPGPAKSLVVAVAEGPVVAGTPADFTVTALDSFGNVAVDYAGTVHFTTTDPAAEPPADYTFVPADRGTHTFQIVFKTEGSETITVADPEATFGDVTDPITVAPVTKVRRRRLGRRAMSRVL